MPCFAGVQAAGRLPIRCRQALPQRPRSPPVGRLRWFQVVARACQPPQVAQGLCLVQGACAGSAARRPHATGQPRGRHACAARGAVSGVRAAAAGGAIASPRGALGRGAGGRAVLPSHTGGGWEVRDPLVERCWSLVRPRARPELDFRFVYSHFCCVFTAHHTSQTSVKIYSPVPTTPLRVVQCKNPHIQTLLWPTIPLLINNANPTPGSKPKQETLRWALAQNTCNARLALRARSGDSKAPNAPRE